MNGSFMDFVIDELRVLLAEIEAGQEPTNITLYEKVVAELRTQYEPEFTVT